MPAFCLSIPIKLYIQEADSADYLFQRAAATSHQQRISHEDSGLASHDLRHTFPDLGLHFFSSLTSPSAYVDAPLAKNYRPPEAVPSSAAKTTHMVGMLAEAADIGHAEWPG